MPKAARIQDSPAKKQQSHDYFSAAGEVYDSKLVDWEPSPEKLRDFIFQMLEMGEQVSIKSTASKRVVSIQVWNWDMKRDPYVFTEWEELEPFFDKMAAVYARWAADQEKQKGA